MIRRGEPWAVPTAEQPAGVVEGGDPALAEAVAVAPPGTLLAFRPVGESDLARALGRSSGNGGGRPLEAPVDVMRLGDGRVAVNAVVLGAGPHEARWWHRSTFLEVVLDGRCVFEGAAVGVVVANGPFLSGRDVAPGAHPGDARMEVMVCAVARRERAEMRRRTATGSHMPHPAITMRRGRHVALRAARGLPLTVDGVPSGRAGEVEVTLAPSAVRLYLGG